MRSEVVRMDIGDKIIHVDCNFLFHNSGPACTVRMGFPDSGLGAAEPFQGEPLPTGPKLHGTFLSYESYVDGKKVPTKLAPTDDRGLMWHTKIVSFKANSDCRIHDVYTLTPGQQLTSENGGYHQTYYVLHTGASWHGPIGSCEIIAKFGPNTAPAPLELKPLPDPDTKGETVGNLLEGLKWSNLPKGTVFWQGPSAPKVDGMTVRFVRNNFKPEKKDDVQLYYGFKLLTNMQ